MTFWNLVDVFALVTIIVLYIDWRRLRAKLREAERFWDEQSRQFNVAASFDAAHPDAPTFAAMVAKDMFMEGDIIFGCKPLHITPPSAPPPSRSLGAARTERSDAALFS